MGGQGGGIDETARIGRIGLTKQGNGLILIRSLQPGSIDGRNVQEGLASR